MVCFVPEFQGKCTGIGIRVSFSFSIGLVFNVRQLSLKFKNEKIAILGFSTIFPNLPS
jgi:hypothetical protein